MHNVAVAEKKVREGSLIKKVKVENKSVNKIKQAMQEAEQKKEIQEENMHRIDKAVALMCTNFVDQGITDKMFPESNVT